LLAFEWSNKSVMKCLPVEGCVSDLESRLKLAAAIMFITLLRLSCPELNHSYPLLL
jgi:hypothetical protein